MGALIISNHFDKFKRAKIREAAVQKALRVLKLSPDFPVETGRLIRSLRIRGEGVETCIRTPVSHASEHLETTLRILGEHEKEIKQAARKKKEYMSNREFAELASGQFERYLETRGEQENLYGLFKTAKGNPEKQKQAEAALRQQTIDATHAEMKAVYG